jgi:membrane protein YdbS with pleckstrin-like domain
MGMKMADTRNISGDLEQLLNALRTARQRLPLSDEQIVELARRATIRDALRGQTIIKQEQPAKYLYFIISGQLRAADIREDPPRLLNYHAAKTFVGERGMLHNEPRAAEVDVVSDAKLARWERKDFEWLLNLNDQVRPYFEDLYRRREQRARRPFPGKQWDEVTVIRSHKHPLMLLGDLIWPSMLLLFSLLVLVSLLVFGLLPLVLFWPLIALPAFIALVWGIFNFINWRNDDYIVTSKRVIHIERYIIYGEERDEAPLIRIQDVNTRTNNLWERLLNYYDVTIQTAGAGTITFRGIRDAEEVKNAIFEERAKAQERREAGDKALIRKLLAKRMGEDIPDVKVPVDTLEPRSGYFEEQRRLPPLLDYLWPRTTVIEGDTITWRKHLFIWLTTVWPALLLFLGLLALMILVLLGAITFGPLATGAWLIELLLGIGVFLSFMWYIYRYDGWYRDIYILTSSSIVDVESSSFRLQGEQRRTGTFDVIQNITYTIPGTLYQILNMGSVFIETAAVAGNFTFENVFDPSAVQQEIYNRMVAYQEEKRRQEQTRQDQRMADWFSEYYHLREPGSGPREGDVIESP